MLENIQFEKQVTIAISTNNTGYLTNCNCDKQPLMINCPNGGYIVVKGGSQLGVKITAPTTGLLTLIFDEVTFGTYSALNWNIPLSPNVNVIFYTAEGGATSLPIQANIIGLGGSYRPTNYTRTVTDPTTPDGLSQNLKGIDNKLALIEARLAVLENI